VKIGLAVRLMGALPTMTMPPQSPGARLPAGLCDVNTIGSAAVPFAMILEPRSTHRELPVTSVSPTILVPAWIVSVAPLLTFT
jgi:hypothetical protein